MDEAVDHCCGDDAVTEDFTPPAEWFFGGHDEAGAFEREGTSWKDRLAALGSKRI
ncbi:hypothetical protein GCM10009701_53390 [Mycolicibacterium murale]